MGLLDTSLEVVKLAAKLANPELVQAATKANIEALELSRQNLELQKRVKELEDKVRELDGKLTLTGEVFRHSQFVFREGDPDPCCSHCWDADRKLIHVLVQDSGLACPHCRIIVYFADAENPRMKNNVA